MNDYRTLDVSEAWGRTEHGMFGLITIMAESVCVCVSITAN